MQASNNGNKATGVAMGNNAQQQNNAVQQKVAAPQLSANAQKRYVQRINAALAKRAAKHAARIAARAAAQQALANQQAYQTALAQLAATYGFAPPSITPAPRANSATLQPSANQIQVNGVWYKPTHAVHALAALHNGNRKATLAACAAHGINVNTAQTQFAAYKKLHPSN